MVIVESWNDNKRIEPTEEGIYLVYGRDYYGVAQFAMAQWVNDNAEQWAGWENHDLQYIDYWTPFIAPENK
jgi:hypothetical protein